MFNFSDEVATLKDSRVKSQILTFSVWLRTFTNVSHQVLKPALGNKVYTVPIEQGYEIVRQAKMQILRWLTCATFADGKQYGFNFSLSQKSTPAYH
jgi:hypothetical protein